MKKSWVVLAIIVLVVFLGIVRPPKPAKPEPEADPSESAKHEAVPAAVAKTPADKKPEKETKPALQRGEVVLPKRPVQALATLPPGQKPPNALKYVIDDGLAVVQGDIVVGVPVNDDGATSGLVLTPTVTPWKSREIPIFVQANVSHPERVRQALELFSDTAVRFVPYTDQEDVVVFEEAAGVCKSYVGHVGGKQPIWIGPGCETTEVAHEIMHALGFVHEQNRADRDQYVEIYPDNIEEQYLYNFDKLPEETTKISSLTDFDFESIMMYPTTMFAKGGRQTMRSKTPTPISPSSGLSAKDKERLQKAYGHL